MPYNQNVQSIGLADEPNMGLPAPASDNHESSETADDVIDSLCSESTWPQHIRINQKDRVVDSAVFHDSLPIRAGLIVVGVIALLGLGWIVRSSLSPSHLPSSPTVQIASSALFLIPREILLSRLEAEFVRLLWRPARRRARNTFPHQRATVRSCRRERLLQQVHQ